MRFDYRHFQATVEKTEASDQIALAMLSNLTPACLNCAHYLETKNGEKLTPNTDYSWCLVQDARVGHWSICEKFKL